MLLNSNSLNEVALNSADFISAEGSGSLIGIKQYVVLVESGVIASISQTVYFEGSGALISIGQEVELQLSGSGQIIEFGQSVLSYGNGALISIEQEVESGIVSTFLTRNGWDLVATLGSYSVPREHIQEVEVTHGINDDSRCTVKLNPGSGIYNLYSYQGKQLTISVRTNGSSFKRIFTGIVDIPRVETVNEKIVLEGVSVRETLIRQYMTPYVAGIGYYSTTVFGPRNNVFKETTDRMTTLAADLDFDASGNWTITSWTPKSVADITLQNSDLYREQQPEVRIESGREVVNTIGITINYNYQRLHETTLGYQWTSGLQPCDLLTGGNTLPTREMIRTAAAGAGWKLDTISFTNIWPSGWYRCGDLTIGWVNTRQNVLLSNSNATAGNAASYSVSQTTATSEISTLLAIGAQWSCRKRFTQNVQESYSLVVSSAQSQSLYGIREQNENLDLQAEFDPEQWEDESLYSTVFPGTKIGSVSNYYINQDSQATELSNSIITALNKAKTQILSSHRDTEIGFTTFINPNFELRHTIELNADRIQCKGKVRSITHKFSASGEATSSVKILLYRSVGSSSNTNLNPPSRPSYSAPSGSFTAAISSRWGQDPSKPYAQYWNGYIGNKWVTTGGGFNTNTFKSTYQESFVVDTPSIPDNRRLQQNYTQSGTYNVAIPTDDLTVTFLDS